MPGDDKFHLNSPARFYANVSKGGGGKGGGEEFCYGNHWKNRWDYGCLALKYSGQPL